MDKGSRDKKLRQLYNVTKEFARIFLVWLGILLTLSVFEVLFNGFTHEFPEYIFSVIGLSLIKGVVFWLKWLWLEYLLFVIIYFVSKKSAIVISYVLIFLLAITQLLLINYFNASLLPLGGDLYGYSIADIKQTVGASGSLNAWIILGFLLLLAGIIFVLRFFPKRIKISGKIAMTFPIISFLLLLVNANSIGSTAFQSDFANNLVINKSDYFFSASYDYFFPQTDDVDIYSDGYIADYESGNSSLVNFEYVNESEYPFLHKEQTADVLTPFINPGKAPPNIVFILVEGLGRAFTNEGAYLGNFTPFIDSLANKSLYWKNILSEGGRTFAVLPSLMGSLPFAKNGFLELNDQMPDHLSLYSLLKHNNYRTSFYYGGDSKFDNMKTFLQKNAVDEIRDGVSFPNGYTKLPVQNGFTWGYADDQLFNYFLNTRNQVAQKPELSVVLTVATHNPFLINNQDKYLKLFEARMRQLNFEEEKKVAYRNYKLQYSSVLYTDDALRNFFVKYQKRSDYANTIFVITGDHRMPEIPMNNKIDRYHVPLIIFSPMLKRTAQMESISTHFDITPSILAYLKTNYKMKIPTQSSWMGTGLDTARNFRNVHQYPMIQTKTDMLDFVMGEYHLNGNTLFKLNSDMQEVAVEDESVLNEMKNKFASFKKRNNKIANGAKIWPDSLIKNYSPNKQ
ncbi:LTA synthase family protein [Pedobacter frigiditerrae]|uniref:LTA synthase family protein n=1 Tax=Pedobacter frigiditerrae TaxID=2530452 RepID=A0A4R0MT83_9SPHI|nr:sulfatase-like hydrolase/transferase [Pedobacter frigiditerrae]TCC89402.1 LTA synthase family protein [Pedobacter frigiditerrae]